MPDLPNLANLDYVDRVNRAIDHITRNLRQPLPLEEVARVACFSPYHFHRVFRALVGETLAAFVKRVRLERAVFLLSHRKGDTLTEIALACGFSSSSDFSRSFRAYYGVPPSTFDVERFRSSRRADHHLPKLAPGENPDGFAVNLRELPSRRVAYARVLRPYEGNRVEVATTALVAWPEERGLADGQWLGWQWDDPEIVAADKCRYDIGVVIDDAVDVDDGASVTRLPPMLVAELDLAGTVELELRALDWLYGTWLPHSGMAPDHHPGFEAFHGRPFAHGNKHFEFHAQIPVVDASKPL